MGAVGFCPAVILTLFVTCIGVIMGYLLYMNRQLTRLNNTVTAQQDVLSTLIKDIKSSHEAPLVDHQYGASPVAIKVAKMVDGLKTTGVDGHDNQSDSDSNGSNSEDDSSDDEPDEQNAIVEKVEEELRDSPEDVSDAVINSPFGDISSVMYMGGVKGTISMDEIGIDNIKDVMDKMSGLITNESGSQYDIDVDELDDQPPDDAELQNDTPSTIDVTSMKVSELRSVVTDKMGPVANLSKLKKNELIDLLGAN